jgi:D-amino peptidase
MRVLISVDMEGLTGVTCPEDCEYGAVRWESARQLMMADVNAAVEGFFDAGATEVVVNDAHSNKRNLILPELDPRASAIIGTHKQWGMLQGIADTDAVAFIGYHTGAGHQGILAHTYIGETIRDVHINGVSSSEGRMNALVAGEFDVPVVLVTGDDLTCFDAATYAPESKMVAVKYCIDRYTARCLAPSVTAAMIRDAARDALAGVTPPMALAGPFTYEVFFDAANPVMASTAVPGVEATSETSVAFTLPTMREAIRCFKAVSTMASASTEPEYG